MTDVLQSAKKTQNQQHGCFETRGEKRRGEERRSEEEGGGGREGQRVEGRVSTKGGSFLDIVLKSLSRANTDLKFDND